MSEVERAGAPASPLARIAALVPAGVWNPPARDDRLGVVARVLHCLQSAPAFGNEIAILTDGSVAGCCCEPGAAEAHKKSAAEAFREGRHEHAAALFTSALRHTDASTRIGQALEARLFANRAQCCLRLACPESAVRDATNAIGADPSYTKAYYRRAKAHQALEQDEEAAADVRAALKTTNAAPSEVEELQALLQEVEMTAKTGDTRVHSKDHRQHLRAEQSTSASAPTDTFECWWSRGAGKLRVEHQQAQGRYCVAREDVAAGEELLQDEPFESVLRKRHRKTHCWACFEPLPRFAPVPSSTSPWPSYCSLHCRSRDEELHPCELGKPWALVLPEEVLLALRCALRCRRADSPRRRAGAEASPMSPVDSGGLASGTGLRGDIEIAQILALESHVAEFEARALRLSEQSDGATAECDVCMGECGCRASFREMVVLGCIAAACVGSAPDGAADGLADLAACVVTFLGRVQVNGFAIVDPSRLQMGGDAQVWRLAVGIYPRASLLNHACSPNTHVSFQGGKLVVRAAQRVAAGSAVTHCYGPQRGLHSRRHRQRLLRAAYNFSCACASCVRAAAGADLCEAYLHGARCRRPSGGGENEEGPATGGCHGVVCFARTDSEASGTEPAARKCLSCGHVLSEDEVAIARSAEREGRQVLEQVTATVAGTSVGGLLPPRRASAGSCDTSDGLGLQDREQGLAEAARMLEEWRLGLGARLHAYHPLVGEIEDMLSHIMVATGRLIDACPYAMRAAHALEARFGGAGTGCTGRQGGGDGGASLEGEDEAGARCANMIVAHGLAWAGIVAALAGNSLDCLTYAAAAGADFRICLGRDHRMCARMLELSSAAAASRLLGASGAGGDSEMYACIYGTHPEHWHQENEAAMRALAVEFESLSAAHDLLEREPLCAGRQNLEAVGRRVLLQFQA